MAGINRLGRSAPLNISKVPCRKKKREVTFAGRGSIIFYFERLTDLYRLREEEERLALGKKRPYLGEEFFPFKIQHPTRDKRRDAEKRRESIRI